jgi:amino acid adenylation domain-containing protein
MQEGMLFHTLASSSEGMYVQQLPVRISGPLNVDAFKRAWQTVVSRYQTLRSAFVWESVVTPLQVVFRSVELKLVQYDWRSETKARREVRWRELLESDRTQNYALRRPPLMRLILVRIGEREYRFLFSYHHIILDGGSGSTVFKDFMMLYDGYSRSVDVRLPQPVPLERYADWVRNRSLVAPESFFRKYLEGLRSPTPLYEDRRNSRSLPQDSVFELLQDELSTTVTSGLGAFARTHRLTLGTVLQGAWAAMLHRHSGERDVLFGAVSSGRSVDLAGVEQLVGMFINTLPARVRFNVTDRLASWLQKLQREMAELREWEYAPLIKIHPWSEIPAGLPLFETCQVLENVTLDVSRPYAIAGVEFTVEAWHTSTSDPITFLAFPGDTLKLQFLYDRARVAPRTAERLLGHLKTWLTAVPQSGDIPVVTLPVLTDVECRELSRFAEGSVTPIPEMSVQELVSAQVERTPDAVAVRDLSATYTYRQLEARANEIAQKVIALGANRGSRIGLSLERSVDMVAAVLGVLKAGATYVPLDPAFPNARIALMAQDAELTALITQKGCLEQLPLPESRVIFLERTSELEKLQTKVATSHRTGPEDIAYVLYTSGSTGKPKGVEISQRALVNFFTGMQALPAVKPTDVLLAVTSLSFDIAGLELFSPLLVGAQVVVAPQAAVVDGVALRELLEQSGATVIQATPSTFRMLLAAQWKPKANLRILVGGESLSPDLARDLCGGDGEVWNMYGPTETTIWSTTWKVKPNTEISIGRPIANTQVYVVDDSNQLVPVGVVGELLIGGASLARGYLHQPELTSERFVVLPEISNSRLYRTGDLARLAEDGTLVVLGRKDSQVKVRGHRIELGEIEAAINSNPAVHQSAVTVVSDGEGDKTIVGYVVADVEAAQSRSADLEREQGNDWEQVWDGAYEGDSAELPDPTFNTRGWNSSYDGKPISSEQMRDWLDATVSRVQSLGPRRILEVGCGTGLILFRLVRDCEAYTGVDFSARALASIQTELAKLDNVAGRVSLLKSDASELLNVADGAFDTAILNSVLQYFPSVGKVLVVIEKMIQKVDRDGKIFIGDLRDLGLHAAAWTSVHLAAAEPRMTARELRERVERSLSSERELLVDREFFTALPGRVNRVAAARVLLKRGRGENEMTRFRHDVLLRLDHANEMEEVPERVEDWTGSRMTLDSLKSLLTGNRNEGIVVRGIPNSRVLSAVLAARWLRREGFDGTVEALQRELSVRAAVGIHPEDVWAVAQELGLSAELTPTNDTDELFDATFRTTSTKLTRTTGRRGTHSQIIRPWSEYGNNPLQARLGEVLIPLLKKDLGEKLPSYMVPSTFVFMNALPLTPNGKVDRRALVRPERSPTVSSQKHLPPRDGLELQLVQIWENIFGMEPIGVHEDFFELGGHSILAVRLAAQVEKRLLTRLTVSSFLDARTVEAQAQLIRARRERRSDALLVCVQEGGKKAPLFCVHPAGGDVLCYRDLALTLGPDYPMYAFEAAIGDDGKIRDRSVIEMATAYVSELQQLKRHGPYRLAGWSLGGLVAAEMAEILRTKGEKVSFLGVFDTVLTPLGFEFDLLRFTSRFVRYVEVYYKRPLGISLQDLARLQSEGIDSLISYITERMHAAQVLPLDVDLNVARRMYDTFMEHTKAFFAHQPSRYTGRLTLMRAQSPLPPDMAPTRMPSDLRTLGWSEYCDHPVNVIDVPGDHITVLTQGPVRTLAERLGVELDRSELQ